MAEQAHTDWIDKGREYVAQKWAKLTRGWSELEDDSE
jgi:hypothetical protein